MEEAIRTDETIYYAARDFEREGQRHAAVPLTGFLETLEEAEAARDEAGKVYPDAYIVQGRIFVGPRQPMTDWLFQVVHDTEGEQAAPLSVPFTERHLAEAILPDYQASTPGAYVLRRPWLEA